MENAHMPEPTMQDLLSAVQAVASDVGVVKSQLTDLKSDIHDHESRLRKVEQRTDQGQRIDAIETRVTQHDAALTKHGERLGAVEAGSAAMKERIDAAAPAKAHWSVGVSVGLSILLATVAIVSLVLANS